MADWSDYSREEVERTAPKPGKRRCVIVSAEESISKTSGKPMIIVTVTPSGSTAKVKSYIVKNERWKQNMTALFDAFPEIGEGNFEFLTWIGAMGAAEFGLEKGSDGNDYLKVKWFIPADKATDLPEFEGEKPEKQEFTEITDSDEDELPFM